MNLLITAAGTGTAFPYGLAISKFYEEINLFTGDTNSQELVSSSIFANSHIEFPYFNEHTYLDFLNKVIAEYQIDIYIPIIDSEVLFASKNIKLINTNVACNNFAFCKAAVTKNEYKSLLKKTIMNHVPNISYKEFCNASFAVAKKNTGFGSLNTIIKKNGILNKTEEFNANDWFFYMGIDGEEFTVDCFPDLKNNNCFVTVRQRIEVKAGVSTKCKIMEDPILKDFALEITKQFELSHPFCFQVIKNIKGEYYLIDLNPRLGAGSAISSINGMDFHAAHLAMIFGKNFQDYLKQVNKSCIVTRQYFEILTKVIE